MYKKKEIIKLSGPVFFSLLAQNIVGITDTAFLGRISEVALGGAAMAAMIYFSIFTLGFGLGAGTQIMVARRFGEKRYDAIGRIFGQSSLLLVGAALVAVALSYWGGNMAFQSLIKSKEVADAASEYWSWRIWGFIIAFQTTTYRALYVGIGKTKVLTYNAIVMAIVNILLDYTLIFGHFGFPELGVKGAAIASVCAEVSSLLFYYNYTHRRKEHSIFCIPRLPKRVDLKLMQKLFNLSFYIMLQAFVSMMVWSVFFFFIEKLGERALAVATIVRSLYIFLYIPVSSFSTVVNSAVGHLIGRGEQKSVISQVLNVSKLSVGTMGCIILLINLIPHYVLRIFTPDPTLIEAAIPSLRMITLALIICSFGNMFFSAVSATGATRMAMNIEFVTVGFYLLYSWFMTQIIQAPVHWCFAVEALYYIFIGLLSYRFIASNVWQESKWRKMVDD